MTLHTEVLSDRQARVLDAIASVAQAANFYLAGGTALALRFGHRRSDDLDWFAADVRRPEALAATIREAALAVDSLELAAGTVNCRIDGVNVQFLEFAYPLLAASDTWPEKRVAVASVRDLGAMKLLAIAQRGSRKDFVDVYELLRQGARLSGMLDDFRAKFQADPISVLRGLAFFDDAELEPMPEMLAAVTWSNVRDGITDALRAVLR
ncbi:MAG: nucleotidyl transferase AbiEii/AbiGii toxin family protein [Acidobacteriota bacterium]